VTVSGVGAGIADFRGGGGDLFRGKARFIQKTGYDVPLYADLFQESVQFIAGDPKGNRPDGKVRVHLPFGESLDGYKAVGVPAEVEARTDDGASQEDAESYNQCGDG
jgi:hypothetical protein